MMGTKRATLVALICELLIAMQATRKPRKSAPPSPKNILAG